MTTLLWIVGIILYLYTGVQVVRWARSRWGDPLEVNMASTFFFAWLFWPLLFIMVIFTYEGSSPNGPFLERITRPKEKRNDS